MNKKERDNRSKQMNPNNIAYYKSRMGNPKPRPKNNLGFACKLCGRAGKLYVTGVVCPYMNCGYCNGFWKI